MMALTWKDHAQNLDAREPVFLHGRFFGVSTDDKPTTLDDGSTEVPSGMLFDEVDTGDRYRYDGNGWRLVPVAATTDDKILAELQQLNSQLGELATLIKLSL